MNIIPNTNHNLELIDVWVFLNTTTGAWKVDFSENLLIGWSLDDGFASPVCAGYQVEMGFGVDIDNEPEFDGYAWEMMVYNKSTDLWHTKYEGAVSLERFIEASLGRIRLEKLKKNIKVA